MEEAEEDSGLAVEEAEAEEGTLEDPTEAPTVVPLPPRRQGSLKLLENMSLIMEASIVLTY